MAGSSPFNVINFFVTKFSEKTFRKNSNESLESQISTSQKQVHTR